MTFKTYPLRFRLFHSDIKQGNLTAFILSSHMTLVHAIIFSLLRYCMSFTYNWRLKEGIEGSFLKLMAINNYSSFKNRIWREAVC